MSWFVQYRQNKFQCLPEALTNKQTNRLLLLKSCLSDLFVLKVGTAALLSIFCHHSCVFWYFLSSLFIYSSFHFSFLFSPPFNQSFVYTYFFYQLFPLYRSFLSSFFIYKPIFQFFFFPSLFIYLFIRYLFTHCKFSCLTYLVEVFNNLTSLISGETSNSFHRNLIFSVSIVNRPIRKSRRK